MDHQVAVNQVRQFLALHPLDKWWPGLNPECMPLIAAKPAGIATMVRLCCPEIGDARTPVVQGIIRDAGYELVPFSGGRWTVERAVSPALQVG